MSERMIDLSIRDIPKSISAESFTKDLITEFGTISTDRLDLFVNRYNKEFKKELMNPFFLDDLQPSILRMMKGSLVLYALNLNGQVLIDLAATLERYAIIYITELFSSFPARKEVVRDLLEKQFLDKLAKHLVTLGIWEEEDKKGIQKLKKLRDSIAHKNVEHIRKELNDGKPLSVPEIDLVMSEKDVLPHIMMTVRLLFKLMDRFYTKTDRYIIAQQIIDGKIKDATEFLQ